MAADLEYTTVADSLEIPRVSSPQGYGITKASLVTHDLDDLLE